MERLTEKQAVIGGLYKSALNKAVKEPYKIIGKNKTHCIVELQDKSKAVFTGIKYSAFYAENLKQNIMYIEVKKETFFKLFTETQQTRSEQNELAVINHFYNKNTDQGGKRIYNHISSVWQYYLRDINA